MACLLRHRLNRFAGSRKQDASALALREVVQLGHPTFLFGSVIRNLLLGPSRPTARDLDLVVDGVSSAELMSVFKGHAIRATRFGGLRVWMHGAPVDVWPIAETWAFRELGLASPSFADLPRTTFLDIEAVTAQASTSRGKPREVYSNGFFESLLSRCIDINLEENPFPDLCVVRALITAQRLKFAVGPRLAKYVLHYAKRIPIEKLADTARRCYPQYECHELELHGWVKSIREQLRTASGRRVRLAPASPRVEVSSLKRISRDCRAAH